MVRNAFRWRPDDSAGRRLRSLDLYGVTAAYRREDGFSRDFAEIVATAHRFLDGTCASLDLFAADDHVVTLAQSGDCRGHGAAAWAAVAAGLRADVVMVAEPASHRHPRDGADDDPSYRPGSYACAPLVGREKVAIGLLTVFDGLARPVDPGAAVLLKHLAGAAIGVLDRQRRAWERRGRPGATPLRSVDGPDRRAEGPDRRAAGPDRRPGGPDRRTDGPGS